MLKALRESFIYVFLAGIYIGLVALLMVYADKIFGKVDSIFSGFAFLILFSLSALVVGGLLIGKPVMLYLDRKKKEATFKLIACGVWLFLFLLIALSVLWLK